LPTLIYQFEHFGTPYTLRRKANNYIKVPEKPMTGYTGVTYCGAKKFNTLPNNIKETQLNPN
jgi:hypothetical protein